MRIVLVALIFCFIGFLGFYLAFRLGAKSKAELAPVAVKKKHGFFSKEKNVEVTQSQHLIEQLTDIQTELLNKNYRAASRIIDKIEDLTPTYKAEWQQSIDSQDKDAIDKIHDVIDDLKAVLA
jgi:thymidylate synthase